MKGEDRVKKMVGYEQMNTPLRDLIEITHFTEKVSAKIHGMLYEPEIYRIVKREFAKSKQYTVSIFLLTEDGSSLRIAETSMSSGKLTAGKKAAGLRLKKLTEIESLINEISDSVSGISSDLRPAILDELGLASVLHWYTSRFSKLANIDVKLQTTKAAERLSDESKTVLYRTVQEALTNILKHSKANKVDIQLKPKDKFVELRIDDNGVGFEMKSVLDTEKRNGGLGLLGMRERIRLVGGTVDIISHPGEGIKLFIRVPY